MINAYVFIMLKDDSQLDTCINWQSPTTNIPGISGTPDYFNQCASNGSGVSVPESDLGFQYAHSGGAYAGIYLRYSHDYEYKEYIEDSISQPLVAGYCYHFEMYVNLANRFQLSTDNIQVYFSDTAVNGINNYQHLPFTPQVANATGNYFDTLIWTLVSGDYTAHGGETNIIIGNFIPDSLTDTLFVNSAGLDWSGIYCYIDDISLSLCTGINENEKTLERLTIYPNPVKEKCKIKTWEAINKIIIKNTAGENVYSVTGNKKEEMEIDIKNLRSGIYFLEAYIRDEIIFKKLIKM